MTSVFPTVPAIWGYSVATLIFVVFAIRFLISGWAARRGFGWHTRALLCAVVMSALWASAEVATITRSSTNAEFFFVFAKFFDAMRMAAWLVFLCLLVTGWDGRHRKSFRSSALPLLFFLLGILLILSTILPQPMPWTTLAEIENLPRSFSAFYPQLGCVIVGLALVEQLYRRTPKNRKWAIKPLVIGLGGMFALDVVIFSGAVLFRQVDPEVWATRGISHAFVMLFVAVATRRNTDWTLDLHVSRDVVFHSTGILIVGCYLLIVAGAAYWVNFFGGAWGATLQVALIFFAMLALATLALSGTLRSRLKVLISKNLFAYRYEYRKEWLRFTAMLGTSERDETLYQQVVRAHADLVESGGGAIWLERYGTFDEVARLDMPDDPDQFSKQGVSLTSLVSFLSRTGWVIVIDEALKFPDRYPALDLPVCFTKNKAVWLIVPLLNGTELTGFVIVARPRVPIDVNWEVLDLLKTASRQAASYLAQFRAKETLVELEKFDAFNRMSAFVVHDLKNLVAQLVLMLKNAERHRENPEFQRDMLETVEHVVGRMNHLMLQLRTGTTPVEKPHIVDLNIIIAQIVKTKAVHGVSVESELVPNIRVFAHADRIERVIGHILQNAMEATMAAEAEHKTGRGVRLQVCANMKNVVIEIIDDGIGMSEEFIRERLFHPFQTTKTHGMGIGMYESFQYMSSIGGSIKVTSTLGYGTTFLLLLPNPDQQLTASQTFVDTPNYQMP